MGVQHEAGAPRAGSVGSPTHLTISRLKGQPKACSIVALDRPYKSFPTGRARMAPRPMNLSRLAIFDRIEGLFKLECAQKRLG